MQIRPATLADVPGLASLFRSFTSHHEAEAELLGAFTEDLERWWDDHRDSHLAFLAVPPTGAAAGMAWLAITARAPRPGNLTRASGDVQSVFVEPEHRGAGVGSALVRAVLEHADRAALEHVTVHANQRALSLYERAGFTPDGELLMRQRPAARQPHRGHDHR